MQIFTFVYTCCPNKLRFFALRILFFLFFSVAMYGIVFELMPPLCVDWLEEEADEILEEEEAEEILEEEEAEEILEEEEVEEILEEEEDDISLFDTDDLSDTGDLFDAGDLFDVLTCS